MVKRVKNKKTKNKNNDNRRIVSAAVAFER